MVVKPVPKIPWILGKLPVIQLTPDLKRATKQIVARTFMTLELYLLAGLIYFLINYAIERMAKAAERRVALPG